MGWDASHPVGTDLFTNSHSAIRANWNALEQAWLDSTETWTYVSATSFKITGVDKTAKYSAGMYIKLTQTTIKYFMITSVSFSGDTTINIDGGGLYTLANAAITLPFFSTANTPFALPAQLLSGWLATGEAWSYGTTDAPTFTITVPTDATLRYSVGMRIRITQATGGTKFFIITAVAATTLTVYGGTDYTLNNEAIFNPFFSNDKAPFGMPMNRSKWDFVLTDANDKQKAGAGAGTFYGGLNAYSTGTNITLNIPIGEWEVEMSGQLYTNATGAQNIYITACLSSSNNSISNLNLRVRFFVGSVQFVESSFFAKDNLVLAAKTPYYLLIMSDVANQTLNLSGSSTKPTVIRCKCNYL